MELKAKAGYTGLYDEIGIMYEETGNFDAALTSYGRAIKGGYTWARAKMAHLLNAQGKNHLAHSVCVDGMVDFYVQKARKESCGLPC